MRATELQSVLSHSDYLHISKGLYVQMKLCCFKTIRIMSAEWNEQLLYKLSKEWRKCSSCGREFFSDAGGDVIQPASSLIIQD